uniref:GUN4-like domain-containing protein n=1 Tax=Tolypiocladia glomerulata TaxID=860646 RepID=A0A1Z1MV92_9FLOR|nr:hypothetical protein [Tolypiocladia glomerulata]ARW69654.1 hypothetical protein [Tolypiocladia glomerulata]
MKQESIKSTVSKIFAEEYEIISTNTEKKIKEILINEVGRDIILTNVMCYNEKSLNNHAVLNGFIYQTILRDKNKNFINKLIENLPNGIITLDKSMHLDYQPLQNLLINEKFQEADRLTQRYLCKLVQMKTKTERNWLYFTDIQFIPKKDLFILDLLWKSYSKGKFGFSVQKKIWTKNNKKWDKLWENIKWLKIEGEMKRYPKDFTWTVEAPKGHLPLFNQLRGTQTLSYLFKKIDW